ncbi:thiol-disulfide oxidoreductase DCC family protein [Halomonas sp. E14]|uniref:thiol-disulfide oxidoreductase DCC family protein n=1 Tax=Halomonas sp. E14 TaxID=3397245 RepID=UPI00403EBC59
MNRAETLRAQAPPATPFYDGRCPLCRKEVDWLTAQRHSDRGLFVDIRAKDFDAAPLGTAFTKMMGRLHALDAQGRWYIGMDASRALYAVLG